MWGWCLVWVTLYGGVRWVLSKIISIGDALIIMFSVVFPSPSKWVTYYCGFSAFFISLENVLYIPLNWWVILVVKSWTWTGYFLRHFRHCLKPRYFIFILLFWGGGEIADWIRGIFRIFFYFMKKNWKVLTCNRLILETLRSQLNMPKILPKYWPKGGPHTRSKTQVSKWSLVRQGQRIMALTCA